MSIFFSITPKTIGKVSFIVYSGQSQIGILVSPLISKSKIREIEIYWNNIDLGSGDEISLFEERPSGTLHRVYTVTPDSPNGIRNTGVQFEFIPSTNFSFLQECLSE